ncbi:hypothetical protein Drorol1_Dr00020660 [Drosera rotundifolia]
MWDHSCLSLSRLPPIQISCAYVPSDYHVIVAARAACGVDSWREVVCSVWSSTGDLEFDWWFRVCFVTVVRGRCCLGSSSSSSKFNRLPYSIWKLLHESTFVFQLLLFVESCLLFVDRDDGDPAVEG